MGPMWKLFLLFRYSAKATWDNPWYNNEVCLYSSPREPTNLDDIFPFGIGWGIGTVNSRLWESWPSKGYSS